MTGDRSVEDRVTAAATGRVAGEKSCDAEAECKEEKGGGAGGGVHEPEEDRDEGGAGVRLPDELLLVRAFLAAATLAAVTTALLSCRRNEVRTGGGALPNGEPTAGEPVVGTVDASTLGEVGGVATAKEEEETTGEKLADREREPFEEPDEVRGEVLPDDGDADGTATGADFPGTAFGADGFAAASAVGGSVAGGGVGSLPADDVSQALPLVVVVLGNGASGLEALVSDLSFG